MEVSHTTFRKSYRYFYLNVVEIKNYRFIVGNLDHPEYLLYELSKMEHFRERVDFLRFRYRAQWQLFEMGMTQFWPKVKMLWFIYVSSLFQLWFFLFRFFQFWVPYLSFLIFVFFYYFNVLMLMYIIWRIDVIWIFIFRPTTPRASHCVWRNY